MQHLVSPTGTPEAKTPFHFTRVDYRWLLNGEFEEASFSPDNGHTRQPYPIAPELGEGWLELLPLGLGMTLYRGVHRFKKRAFGHLVTVLEAEVRYDSPSFAAVVAFGSKICHAEQCPRAELIFGPGTALFRHTDWLKVVAKVDASANSEIVGLTLSDEQLGLLLGEAESASLKRTLRVDALPSVAVHRLPPRHAEQLRAAISPQTTGTLRILQAQAKAVGFLATLGTDFGSGASSWEHRTAAPARVREIHDRLSTLEGKLPSLDSLARDAGLSARQLNALFAAEYGAPIHSFITAQRLHQARAAVCDSDIPLKVLAARLGYSHVNHFITAFRRMFGYTPGSLRRGPGRNPESP